MSDVVFANSRGDAFTHISPGDCDGPTIELLDAILTPTSTTLLDGNGNEKSPDMPTVWLKFDTKTGERL
jgi:hypothetical protein